MNIYGAFFIFDEGNIVMLFNGFQKKTQKTPESEIEKAVKLKNEYYASKFFIAIPVFVPIRSATFPVFLSILTVFPFFEDFLLFYLHFFACCCIFITAT